MSRDKQIAAMERVIRNGEVLRMSNEELAEALYEAGYCKASELVEANEALMLQHKILEAKNERLEIICDSYALQYGTVADKEVFLKKERADTVRKMQELIKERCIKGGIYPAFVERTIDQIVKEMVENE